MCKKVTPNTASDAGPESPEAYDRWIRDEVQSALDDPRPTIPHEQVMDRLRARVDDLRGEKTPLTPDENDIERG